MAILVADLIDQGKFLADKRNDASIVDADWLTLVNWRVEALWRKLTALDPAAYFGQGDFTLTGTPSGATKDLSVVSATFRALHGLDLNPDTNIRRTVPSKPFRERNIGVLGWWTPTVFCNDRGYDLRARTLVITPYENASGTYRAYFRNGPYKFTGTSDATALDFQLEPYSEWIATGAAVTGLDIEESSDDPYVRRLAEIDQEIEDEHERDDGAPARIADVEDEAGPYGMR